MQLQKVILNNYGLYKDENIFDFTTVNEKPIILCGGKNGGGKTTLFESVMLCLYGYNSFEEKITKKEYNEILNKKIHKSNNTQNKTDASITIEFLYHHYNRDKKSKEGNYVQHYSVKRSWKNVNGEIVERLDVKKNDAVLQIDHADWERFIRELIPRGIARLFFFDGEKIAKIAKQESEDVEIKNSFEMLLGLDIVNQLKSDLEINLGRGDKKQTELGTVDELENKIEKMKNKIEFLEAEKVRDVLARRKKEDEITDVLKNIDEFELKISKLGGNYADKRVELNSKQVTLEARLTTIEDEIRTLCADALPFSLIPKQLQDMEETLKSDQSTLKNRFEKQILEENLEELKEKLDSDDIWAKLKMDANAKSDVISKIQEIYEDKLTKQSKNQEMVIGFSQKDSQTILDMMSKINDVLPKKLEFMSKEFNDVTEELQKIKTSLANAPNDGDIKPLVENLNAEHEKIGAIKTEIKHLDDVIQMKNAEITTRKIEVRKEIDKKYNSKDINTNAELTQKVQKALDEYSIKLMRKKIHLLESYILESLKILLHKENFIDKVLINNETFEITLYDSEEIEIKKDTLSEGEKQMYATSILWALARTSGRSLPFIIDTPLARLDMDHRDNLVEEFFPAASHQVIILSTDTEITKPYYEKLLPNITRSYSMDYDSKLKCSKISDSYFEFKGEEIAV